MCLRQTLNASKPCINTNISININIVYRASTHPIRGGEMSKRLGVCVCVFSSHPFWTSSSLDVPAGVTQEEGHTGFLIHLGNMSVCVCVCVFSSHPFWTSSSLDVPAGVTQEEVHTGFLIHLPPAVRALIFVARRIQPFLSLVDREVEFCVLTN